MELKINGEQKTVEATTLNDVLRKYELGSNGEDQSGGVAVAVNDTVVPKDQWKEHKLEEHDRIEIIRATQGG